MPALAPTTLAALALLAGLSLQAPSARANDNPDAGTEAPEPPPPSPAVTDALATLLPDIHAFVSQGYIKSIDNNYLVASKRGSFEFNEAAVNFTKTVTDRLRMGLQLYAQDLGPQPDNYQVSVDWLYIDYRFRDWLGFRAGRTKLPYGLYNEVNEIDAARVPVLLPQSVYPIVDRNVLLAQTGGEIYGYLPIGPLGALDYRFYGGQLYIPSPAVSPPFQLVELSVPYIYGARVLWEAPLAGLRMGGSVQAIRLDYQLTDTALTGTSANLGFRIPFVIALASIEYAADNWLLAAEYGRWTDDIQSNTALVPNSRTVSERYYVMGSYHLTPWFTPGLYYSSLTPNIDHRDATSDYQDDVALTLRFDINSHWLFKLEGHYIHGTADVQSSLNGDAPLDSLSRDWAAFFAKTTVYF